MRRLSEPKERRLSELKESIFSIPILLTILPFIGYLFPYIYEFQYCYEFNIPIELISLKIEFVLLFAFFSAMISWIIYSVVRIIVGIRKKKRSLYANKQRRSDESKIVLFIGVILMCCCLCGIIGSLNAKNKTDFYTLGGDSTYVLIKMYGDNYILAKSQEVKNFKVNDILVLNKNTIDSLKLVPYKIMRK